MSEDTCSSCGEINTRSFQEGDTVYGPGKPCAKCASSDTMTTAIYGIYPPEARKD